MANARIIVSELSGRWSFALRTVLVDSGIRLTEVAGLASAFQTFDNDPRALLAFEATEAVAEQGLRLLQLSRRRNPGCGVIVLLDGSLATSVPLWQESGAIAVVESPRHLRPVARLIQRYFDTREGPSLTFREEVWQRMPWRESELESLHSDGEK